MSDQHHRRLRRDAMFDPELAERLDREARRLRGREPAQKVYRRSAVYPDSRTEAERYVAEDLDGDRPRFVHGATGRTGYLGCPGWDWVYDPLFDPDRVIPAWSRRSTDNEEDAMHVKDNEHQTERYEMTDEEHDEMMLLWAEAHE